MALDTVPTDTDLSLKVIDTKQVERIRARLARVFQSFNLWSHMTVLENVIAGPVHVLKQSRAVAIVKAIDGFLNTPQGEGFAFLGENVDDPECLGEGTGIAVRKGDALAAQLSAAILAIRDNGTYAEINDKYFDVDIYGK